MPIAFITGKSWAYKGKYSDIETVRLLSQNNDKLI